MADDETPTQRAFVSMIAAAQIMGNERAKGLLHASDNIDEAIAALDRDTAIWAAVYAKNGGKFDA